MLASGLIRLLSMPCLLRSQCRGQLLASHAKSPRPVEQINGHKDVESLEVVVAAESDCLQPQSSALLRLPIGIVPRGSNR